MINRNSWKNKSIEPAFSVDRGTYLFKAKTYGLKGKLGGKHTWVGTFTGTESAVVEITDEETLEVQRPSYTKRFCDAHHDPLSLYISDRELTQRWFGSKPLIEAKLPYLSIRALNILAAEYPYVNHKFKILTVNCNTFTSWVAFRMNVTVSRTYGWRAPEYWKRLKA